MDFKEYKGMFRKSKNVDPLNQVEEHSSLFNYEIETEDEIQLADADSIKSNEQSENDDINSEVNDFLVDDDYCSGNEEDENEEIQEF